MGEHRWALAIIVRLGEEHAGRVEVMDLAERLEHVRELLPSGEQITSAVEAVRGPMCELCRVSWADVHRDPRKPWPCAGSRPAGLGGQLNKPERRMSRQQRRQAQRKAARQ